MFSLFAASKPSAAASHIDLSRGALKPLGGVKVYPVPARAAADAVHSHLARIADHLAAHMSSGADELQQGLLDVGRMLRPFAVKVGRFDEHGAPAHNFNMPPRLLAAKRLRLNADLLCADAVRLRSLAGDQLRLEVAGMLSHLRAFHLSPKEAGDLAKQFRADTETRLELLHRLRRWVSWLEQVPGAPEPMVGPVFSSAGILKASHWRVGVRPQDLRAGMRIAPLRAGLRHLGEQLEGASRDTNLPAWLADHLAYLGAAVKLFAFGDSTERLTWAMSFLSDPLSRLVRHLYDSHWATGGWGLPPGCLQLVDGMHGGANGNQLVPATEASRLRREGLPLWLLYLADTAREALQATAATRGPLLSEIREAHYDLSGPDLPLWAAEELLGLFQPEALACRQPSADQHLPALRRQARRFRELAYEIHSRSSRSY